jgi:hypothetical protein
MTNRILRVAIASPIGADPIMAAWFDLKDRVAALEKSGLTVVSTYRGEGVPKWLAPALGDCDAFVLNLEGISLDDTLCVVRLSQLEKLLTTASKQ